MHIPIGTAVYVTGERAKDFDGIPDLGTVVGYLPEPSSWHYVVELLVPAASSEPGIYYSLVVVHPDNLIAIKLGKEPTL